MRIVRLEAIPFRLPVRRTFRWAGLEAKLGRFVLVRVHTDDGLVGIGEATPLPDWGGDFGRHGGETTATVAHIVRDVLGPVLVGADPLRVQRAHAAMDRVVRGHSYARNAVDMALHDLRGKASGLPVYELLGGAFRDEVPLAHMIGLMPDDEALAEAEGAWSDGVRAFQVKGGVDAPRDVRLVAALRDRLDDSAFLRLDANQGYRRAKEAVPVVRDLAAAGVDCVEQPVMGLEEMAAVTAAVDVPVIADESCWDPVEALEVARTRAADALSVYLAKAGGLVPAARVAAIAAAARMPCDVNGSLESAVGTAANVHFAIAHPPVTLPAVISSGAIAGDGRTVGATYFADDIATAGLPAREGVMLKPEGPGLGVTIDEDKLSRYRETG